MAVSTQLEREDRSLGELLRELSQDTSELVRQEMALAKAELEEQGKRAGAGAAMFGGAATAVLLALGAVTAAAIAGMSEAVDVWLAALIVGVVWALVAAVLAARGRSQIRQATPPVPQTVETVKEDVQWAKTLR